MKHKLPFLVSLFIPFIAAADGTDSIIASYILFVVSTVMGLVMLFSALFLWLYYKREKPGYFYTSLFSSLLVFFCCQIEATRDTGEPIIPGFMVLAFGLMVMLIQKKILANPTKLVWYMAGNILFALTFETILNWFRIQNRVFYYADIPVMIWMIYVYLHNMLRLTPDLHKNTLYTKAILFGLVCYLVTVAYSNLLIIGIYGIEVFHSINLFLLLLLMVIHVVLIPAATVFVTLRVQANK